MQRRNGILLGILIVFFLGLSVVLRWHSLPRTNPDMNIFYRKFYDYIALHGFRSMADSFSIGTPLYLYLVWLATLTNDFLSPLFALKLISAPFDLISAFAIYKIVRLKFSGWKVPLLASAMFLALPTVVMNSAMWGQLDSLYTSFLLVCLYFLLTEQPIPAMLAFGVSISLKLQAVFLIPFLAILTFKKRIPWYYFAIPPLVYVATILPAVFAGRPFLDALTIYLSWTNEFTAPSMNAPNLYSLIIVPPYYVDWNTAVYAGLAVSAISIALWIFVYSAREYDLNPPTMIVSALTCFTLVPFVLPRMHDRYFYPADVLSLVFAFYFPSYWFLPVFFQIASGIVYYIFLFSVDPGRYFTLFAISASFTSLALAILLVKQWRETKPIA